MAKKSATAHIDTLSGELLHILESVRQRGPDAYPPTLQRLADLCEGSLPTEDVIKAAGRKPFSERAVVLEKENKRPKLDSPVYFKEDKPSPKEIKERELAGLADRLLRVLESQRRLGGDSYPPPLRRLVELCGLRASDKRIAGAVGHKLLADRLVVAMMKGKSPNLDAPTFLAEDVPKVIPALVAAALTLARTGVVRSFTGKQLASKLATRLKAPVEDALRKGRIDQQHLPPDVVWVAGAKGEPLLFHIDDLRPAARQARPAATPTADGVSHAARPEFAEAFREAFDRLDRRNGTTNFVKLAELRLALPEFTREEFDAGLRRLQIDDRYSLDSHEGLHGTLTPEEREAGVNDGGSLLIYASRR